jgi:hypothetical protein
LFGHRTGFQKLNQLLADGLFRELPDEESRKLIIFTDSRQDAAKLSAGMEMDHYRDLVRQAMMICVEHAKSITKSTTNRSGNPR